MEKCKTARLLLAALVVSLSPVASASELENQPVQKVFKDWQVTCNNLNDCDVRNLDESVRVILTRKAGADAQPEMTIQLLVDREIPSGIWFDGKKLSSDLTFIDAVEEDYITTRSHSLKDIQNWVQASKNAQQMTLSLTEEDAVTSLQGLNAALLLVDERQGRLHNQTALLRVGNNGPAMVPARPVPPAMNFSVPKVVTLTNPQKFIDEAIQANEALLIKEDCDTDKERSAAQPLNDKQALVMVNCGMGAYQSSSMLFISDRDNASHAVPLSLPLPLAQGDGESNLMNWFTEVDYDPEDGLLTFSGRGRGLADCGSSGGWVYDGNTFHLAYYNNQQFCRGGEPGDWPSVWETAFKNE